MTKTRLEVCASRNRSARKLIELLETEKKYALLITELKMLIVENENEYFELLDLTYENNGERIYQTSPVDIE